MTREEMILRITQLEAELSPKRSDHRRQASFEKQREKRRKAQFRLEAQKRVRLHLSSNRYAL